MSTSRGWGGGPSVTAVATEADVGSGMIVLYACSNTLPFLRVGYCLSANISYDGMV